MTPADDRLATGDLVNLAAESPDTPMHVMVVLVCDGGGWTDGDGRLRLAELRDRIDRRLARVPRLRQILHRSPVPGIRPVWRNDAAFDIGFHVRAVTVDPPGGSEELLSLVARLLPPLLDRSWPLWRLWFVTGLDSGRVAVVVKLHHVVADGLATVAMLGSLLGDPDPRGVTDPTGTSTAPGPAPRRSGGVRAVRRVLARSRRTPRTSLNAPVGPNRRMAVARFNLGAAKAVAHASGGKVNDVVLTLLGGGLRALLLARGEAVDELVAQVSVAASLRAAADAGQGGNHTGGYLIPVPLGEPDPVARLGHVVAGSQDAKRTQPPAAEQHFLYWLARTGLLRWFSRRQRVTTVMESNVTGPVVPMTVLGAEVYEIIPVGLLAGNVTLSFLAFSYAGRLSVTILADADRNPDLPVIAAGLRTDWARLTTGHPAT